MAPAGLDMADLRHAIGDVFFPADPGYPAVRSGIGLIPVDDRHPAIVVRPSRAEEVVDAVAYARSHGLGLSVRAGGNDVLGASTTSDGMVIDLALMSGIEIDPATGIARFGGGVRAGALIRAAAVHGLAPVLGAHPHVGVAGLILGGGMGWLSGVYGASVDSLLSVEIVTADGQILTACETSHSELFWALRGGGGNFGVATSFTVQLRPVRDVLTGIFTFDADPAEFLRFYRGYLARSPDELELSLAFSTGPRPAALARACWIGDPTVGEAILEPLVTRAGARASVEVQPFVEFAVGRQVSGLDRLRWRGGRLAAFDDATIDVISHVIARDDVGDCLVGIGHYMHGAFCRVPRGDTPFIRTPGGLMYTVNAFWSADADEEEIARKVRWATAATETLDAVGTRQTYMNYLWREGEDDVRDVFGPHYPRLQAVKRRYDPDNVFRANRNIVPAGA